MQAAQVTIDNFIATPIAGVLFAVSLALPLWVGARGYIIPIALAIMLLLSPLARSDDAAIVPDAAAPDVRPRVRRRAGATPLVSNVSAREAISYLWHAPLPPRDGRCFTSIVGSRVLVRAGGDSSSSSSTSWTSQPAAIGFVTAGIGVGALGGSILAARLRPALRPRRRSCSAANFIGSDLPGIGLTGLAPEVFTAVVGVRAIGAFAISVVERALGRSASARSCPPHLFGRVLGIIRIVHLGRLPDRDAPRRLRRPRSTCVSRSSSPPG